MVQTRRFYENIVAGFTGEAVVRWREDLGRRGETKGKERVSLGAVEEVEVRGSPGGKGKGKEKAGGKKRKSGGGSARDG